jgi:hypothetical protein
MKPTITGIAAPPFDTRNEAARIALKTWTIERVWLLDEEADAGRRYDLLLTPERLAKMQYSAAKSSARCGNLEALRAFLVRLTDDPEIADFIAEPRRPRGQRRRKAGDWTRWRAFRHDAVITVRRVRRIWREQYGKWKRSDGLAEEIAAEFFGLTVAEIQEALKRRTRPHRTDAK